MDKIDASIHLRKIINVFFFTILYFIMMRIISSTTYLLFPKFVQTEAIEKGKTSILIESLAELGTIGILIYLIRSTLGMLNLTYLLLYEKYVIFALNPALFYGPSDLKRKLDFALGY